MASNPIGIITPIRLGTQGYFEQSYSTDQMARINLENVLRTRKGERPMNPLYGSDLHAIIFNPNVDDVQSLVTDAIEEAASIWIPYIVIDGVIVDRTSSNIDQYEANVRITFHVNRANADIQIIEFSIKQD